MSTAVKWCRYYNFDHLLLQDSRSCGCGDRAYGVTKHMRYCSRSLYGCCSLLVWSQRLLPLDSVGASCRSSLTCTLPQRQQKLCCKCSITENVHHARRAQGEYINHMTHFHLRRYKQFERWLCLFRRLNIKRSFIHHSSTYSFTFAAAHIK